MKSWILPNRVRFPEWIYSTFKDLAEASEGEEDEVKLFEHQKFIKKLMQADSPYRGVLLYHGLGVGKCHVWDTPILMADGSIKKVQNIRVGEEVMGDDSTPRRVLSLARGRDAMFDIVSKSGEYYTVNSEHILCLKSVVERAGSERLLCKYIDPETRNFMLRTFATTEEADAFAVHVSNWVHEIPVKEFVMLPEDVRAFYRSYRPHVIHFPEEPLEVDPYYTGYELACQQESHIPHALKINTCQVRLRFLAGLMDRDATLQDNGTVRLTLSNPLLAEEVVFVARSLGLGAKARSVRHMTGMFEHVEIYGKGLESIPCKRLPLHQLPSSPDATLYAFQVKATENVQDYYGFTVDKNHRYVMGDFTVTHNSCSAIVAAEALSRSMDNIVVLLPASLRENFINEIKKCGNRLVVQQQRWTFLSDPEKVLEARTRLGIQASLAQRHQGIWVPDKAGTTYSKLADADKARLTRYIDDLIAVRYTFIHYNGLSRKMIQDMNDDYFRNKTIIIDEVHNFVSTAMKSKTLAAALYQRILTAQNCKLIMLSGTPIINRPFEFAYTANLAKGMITTYEMRYQGAAEVVTHHFEEHKHVDTHQIFPDQRLVRFTLLPEGYEFSDKKIFAVRKSVSRMRTDALIANIQKDLQDVGIVIQDHYKKKVHEASHTLLPSDEDSFNKMFIQMQNKSAYHLKNKTMFSRRILGLVSHYEKYDASLYPSRSTLHRIYSKMSDRQFAVYLPARTKEYEQEKRAKEQRGSRKDDDTPLATGNVFKAFSRAACSFAFPENLERPYPSDVRKMVEEMDMSPEELGEVAAVEESGDIYQRRIQETMNQLNQQKETYLSVEGLKKHSPKYLDILTQLQKSPGSALLYSQFRSVEGLGVFSTVLEAHGWAEFKIRKTKDNSGWELDMSPEDRDKPKYFKFTGNNERTQVLLSIFNSDYEKLPAGLVDQLEFSSQDRRNRYGEVIRLIMITQSGAEGISLKNVRQVHIMEPYWNEIRIQQVIGRAIRARSHIDLPESDRHVDVFMYITKLTKTQRDQFLIKTQDYGFSSDERVDKLAESKANLIGQFLKCIKEAAIDCHIFKSDEVQCFSFDYKLDPNRLSSEPRADAELTDERYANEMKRVRGPKEIRIQQKIKLPDGKSYGIFVQENGEDVLVDLDVFTQLKRVRVVGSVVRAANGSIERVLLYKL